MRGRVQITTPTAVADRHDEEGSSPAELQIGLTHARGLSSSFSTSRAPLGRSDTIDRDPANLFGQLRELFVAVRFLVLIERRGTQRKLQPAEPTLSLPGTALDDHGENYQLPAALLWRRIGVSSRRQKLEEMKLDVIRRIATLALRSWSSITSICRPLSRGMVPRGERHRSHSCAQDAAQVRKPRADPVYSSPAPSNRPCDARGSPQSVFGICSGIWVGQEIVVA